MDAAPAWRRRGPGNPTGALPDRRSSNPISSDAMQSEFAMEEPAVHVPAHAHLWLSEAQQEEWLTLKTQVPTLTFACFVAFNLLSALSLRVVRRKGTIKARSNLVLLQYGITSATHAIISLAAAAYVAVHRKLDRSCGPHRVFCHDDLSARLLCMHAGYALYEILFWQNNSQVTLPWTEMLFLHNVVVLMQALGSVMYPCRLTLLLLPVQQMLEISTLLDCARRFAAVYGGAWHLRFKLQLGFVAGQGVQAMGGAGLAAFAYWWIRENNLWKLDLPEGASALNGVYGILMLAGCLIQALIYIKWLGAALAMTSDLISAVQSSRGAKAAGPGGDGSKAAAKALTAGGRKKKGRR